MVDIKQRNARIISNNFLSLRGDPERNPRAILDRIAGGYQFGLLAFVLFIQPRKSSISADSWSIFAHPINFLLVILTPSSLSESKAAVTPAISFGVDSLSVNT